MEIGIVTDKKEDVVTVKLERKEACAKCNACAAGLTSKDMMIVAENLCQAEVGDAVVIELDQSNFVKAVFIMYVFPLIGLLGGIFSGYYLGLYLQISWNEALAVIFGIIFVGIAYGVIKIYEPRRQQRGYRPKAVRTV